HRRIAILQQVAHETARRPRCWIPVNADPVEGLTPGLSPPRRGDHGNLISRIHERPGLAAHTDVLGVGGVLYQHKDAPTSGYSIVWCTVRCHLEEPPGRIRRASAVRWLAIRLSWLSSSRATLSPVV